jgi:hypothetical protein
MEICAGGVGGGIQESAHHPEVGRRIRVSSLACGTQDFTLLFAVIKTTNHVGIVFRRKTILHMYYSCNVPKRKIQC